jgi:hypothetical protein
MISKRYQLTPTESTFSSYEKYTIPSYDQAIITKMMSTFRRIGSEDDTYYVNVRNYAKQVSNYCYNMLQNAIKKFGNARVYAVVNFTCHSTVSVSDGYGNQEFSFARNLGRIDINNFQDFQKYFINGTIDAFNSVNGKDYIICYGFNNIELNVVKHNPFHGSSYTELPACVKNSKSVINIKNADNKCFLYSILASRHEIASHPERVSHYEKFMNELQWKETDFPMAINKIPFFEKKDNIKVNVYAIDEDSVTSKISLYRSKSQNKEEINLFLHDKHYSYIKNWSRFSGGKQEHVCPNCFWKYKNDQFYKRHLENCHKLNENGSMVIMPKDKIVKDKISGKEINIKPQTMFSDYKKQKQVPVVMYADFECNLEPFHASPDKTKRHDINNRKGVLAVHKPNTFRLHIETKLDLGIELDYVYTGEDCELKFIDLIVNQLEQKIQDKLKACCDRHPTPVWTEMEEIDFQKQELCIFCNK